MWRHTAEWLLVAAWPGFEARSAEEQPRWLQASRMDRPKPVLRVGIRILIDRLLGLELGHTRRTCFYQRGPIDEGFNANLHGTSGDALTEDARQRRSRHFQQVSNHTLLEIA